MTRKETKQAIIKRAENYSNVHGYANIERVMRTVKTRTTDLQKVINFAFDDFMCWISGDITDTKRTKRYIKTA